MNYSTKRGEPWGVKILTFNENSLPKENNPDFRYMQFVSYNDYNNHNTEIVGDKFDDF